MNTKKIDKPLDRVGLTFADLKVRQLFGMRVSAMLYVKFKPFHTGDGTGLTYNAFDYERREYVCIVDDAKVFIADMNQIEWWEK